MAEPAKKLPPPPAEAEIELTLIKKPADKKDNIIDFNQYRRDLNKGKAADKKELEKENTPEPQTEAGKKHKENVMNILEKTKVRIWGFLAAICFAYAIYLYTSYLIVVPLAILLFFYQPRSRLHFLKQPFY